MSREKKKNADGAAPELSFEAALRRLEELVGQLSEGDLSLEASLAAYKEGIQLVKFCQDRLKEVEREILLLTPGEDGEPCTQPFEEHGEE